MKKVAGPMFENKLTKKFFMGLPNSIYVVSNVGISPTQPIFAENIAPESLRLEQWKKIVEDRVDQRLCSVFKNKEAYDNWTASWMLLKQKKGTNEPEESANLDSILEKKPKII